MAEGFSRVLHDRLAARGLRWSAPIEHLSRVDSSNARLMRGAREGLPEWSIAIADEQTAGRGRRGRPWRSPPGSLYLSVLLREAAHSGVPTLIPLCAGVAVAGALEELGLPARLKWPNDVLVEDRKISGILAEGLAGVSGLEAVVVGIGVNLDLDPGSLPDPLKDSVTSVGALLGHSVERAAVAAAILHRLREAVAGLSDGAAVIAAWRERSLAWWGRRLRVDGGDERIEGVARELDATGALVLELDDGSLRTVLAGEASLLRPAEARG